MAIIVGLVELRFALEQASRSQFYRDGPKPVQCLRLPFFLDARSLDKTLVTKANKRSSATCVVQRAKRRTRP
jgi:hypothetical protein